MTEQCLADIHRAFIDGIYNLKEQDPSTFIEACEGMDARQALAVYQGSVFGNLSSALMDIYPATVQCLGEKFFRAMALRYLKEHPSKSASLDDYGELLAEFVAGFEPLAGLPYLPDLAHLEWCWHRAFHAQDEGPFEVSVLAELSEAQYEQVIFSLPESMSLIESAYPLRDIWHACLKDKTDNSAEQTALGAAEGAASTELNLDAGGQKILLWRAAHYELRVEQVTELEYDLLKAIKKCLPLGTILETLRSKYPLEEINQALARAVQQAWFVSISLAATNEE